MARKPDSELSPAEAQNTGPFHQTPPGAPERSDAPPASGATSPIRPKGEAESRDDS